MHSEVVAAERVLLCVTCVIALELLAGVGGDASSLSVAPLLHQRRPSPRREGGAFGVEGLRLRV